MDFALPQFDTAAIADEGAVMTLYREDNGAVALDKDGKPITITLLGSDSAVYRKAQNKNLNRRLAKRNVKLSAEELQAESIETLAACTVAWSGFFDKAGQPIACNAEAARALYTRFSAIREQADNFVNDRANFLQKS